MKKLPFLAAVASIAFATASCNQSAEPPAAQQAQEIAWRHGDVEDALAEAKETGKPVLLYWGAEWCPPCAQMKATLFKDPAFIAKTEGFIPVYLDGDTQGAQKWGEHFGASGYPTVIVLSPAGEEITRLASSTMASELPALLTLAAGRTRSIDAVIADARADPNGLSAEDWRILAGFDWGNDSKRFEKPEDETKLLAALAKAAPDPALKRQFALAVVLREAETDDEDRLVLTAQQATKVGDILSTVLASPAETGANATLLAFAGSDLVGGLPKGEQREKLTALLTGVLNAMQQDKDLSLVERTAALRSEVDLAEREGDVPAALKDKVRKWVATIDKETSDEIARKSVLSFAAGALRQIGDDAAAKKLLLAEIGKSSTPYYYMSSLSDMAEEEGDNAAAVDWARKAYEASEGPATRVQWAAIYSRTVMNLTPDDDDAVRTSAEAVLTELGKSPDSYYQRTKAIVDRWSKALIAWSDKNGGDAVLDALQGQLAKVCAGQGKDAGACGSLMKSA
ncbi:thioredoxin family protein [Croceicoccus bisphenolivorans]|uniref:thioredoxin family protein n=1 Tax=Croceicoccus bisphenolivorans TaxID=1783232 RepID=UPI00083622CE|nr:thioredoxin family protein [Croceicoccus bisphenolivorans]